MLSISFSLAYIIYRLYERKPWGIPFLLNCQWLLLLLFYKYNENQFIRNDGQFDILICSFLIVFSSAYSLRVPDVLSKIRNPFSISPLSIYLLSIISIIYSFITFIYIKGTSEIISLSHLRELISNDSDTERISFGLAFSIPLSLASYTLAQALNHRKLKILFVTSGFLLVSLSTSKLFLLIFFMYLVPLKYRIDQISLRWAITIITCLIGSFTLLHVLLNKIVERSGGIFESLYVTFVTYFSSGLAGLQLYLNGKSFFPHNALWKSLNNYIPWLISIETSDSAILPWSQIGEWYGNVYSAFAYWLDAFGYYGTFVFIFLIATCTRYIFEKKSLNYIFLQRFLLFSIFMIFHQDFFLSSIVMWSVYLFCSFLLSSVRTLHGLSFN